MADTDVSSITKQLEQTSVEEGTLTFAGKSIKLDKEKDAKPIVEAIKKCQSLRALNLEGNTLGVDAAKAIGKALQSHPEFQRALWSDMFTGRLKSEIPQALRFLGGAIMLSGAQLVELDLSDNAFGPNGMEGLTDLLKSKSCYTLKELKLNNNGLGVTGGKMLAKSLLACHKSSVRTGKPLALRLFVSGRGRLENEGSIALSEAFKAMGSLEEVSMPQNGINHEGITALAQAFAANKQLRSINLNDNTFTEKGAKAMADALPHLQNLEVINFGDCLLRNGGVKFIAAALKDGHKKLKELVVSFNEIKKSGAIAVAEVMDSKENLRKLDLDGNQLGEDCIELVRGTMEAVGKLETLASFSDDEGDEDSEEEEEAEDENEIEDEEIQEPSQVLKGLSLQSPQKEVTADEFLLFPSPTKLKQMGPQRGQHLLHSLGDKINDVDEAVKTVVKVSLVVTADDDNTREAAFQCADAVMSKVCTSGAENIASLVSNSILVNIGLLKGEDKKFKPPSDVTGPLLVFSDVVRQNYFPSTAKEILQVFLARPHPLLDKSGSARHQMLQALYQS